MEDGPSLVGRNWETNMTDSGTPVSGSVNPCVCGSDGNVGEETVLDAWMDLALFVGRQVGNSKRRDPKKEIVNFSLFRKEHGVILGGFHEFSFWTCSGTPLVCRSVTMESTASTALLQVTLVIHGYIRTEDKFMIDRKIARLNVSLLEWPGSKQVTSEA
jgi:hypothetical protein